MDGRDKKNWLYLIYFEILILFILIVKFKRWKRRKLAH